MGCCYCSKWLVFGKSTLKGLWYLWEEVGLGGGDGEGVSQRFALRNDGVVGRRLWVGMFLFLEDVFDKYR